MAYSRIILILALALIFVIGCSDQKRSQVQYTTKDRPGLKLSLMLVRPDYSDGKVYVATAKLKNLRVEQPDKFAFDDSETQAGGTPPGVSYTKTVKLAFKEPGTYRIYCRLKDVLLHEAGPDGWAVAVPLKLRTKPIEITVK